MRQTAPIYHVVWGDCRETRLGKAQLFGVYRADKKPMGFRELWEVFEQHNPGRWALQAFPDRAHLLDQANKYWLWVLEEPPREFDLFR